MGIQLGSVGINDIYIGSTNIKKVLLGNTIVYQKQEVVANDYVKDSLFAYYALTQFKLTDTSVTDLTGNGHNMEVSNTGSAIKDSKGGFNTKSSSIVTANIPSNTPSHFAITFGNAEFKAYINGELVHTGNCNSNAGTNAVYLLVSSAVNYSINHTLYSARLYSRVLSASEVSQNRQYEINKYNI